MALTDSLWQSGDQHHRVRVC